MRIFLPLIFLITLVACRKDRECVCVRNNENQTRYVYPLSVSKKAEAEEDCQTFFNTYQGYYSSCELE